jgi:hypothetical protein
MVFAGHLDKLLLTPKFLPSIGTTAKTHANPDADGNYTYRQTLGLSAQNQDKFVNIQLAIPALIIKRE